MARITLVKKAQKDQGKCRRCGAVIKLGDSYFWFANRLGRMSVRKVFCAAHRPRPSEVTTSDKLSQLYGAQEAFEDQVFDSLEDIASALRDAASTAEEVGQEYRDSLDNMPDGLRDADSNGIQEKIDACSDWQGELEQAADEVEGFEMPEEEESEGDKEPTNSGGQTASEVMDEARSRAEDAIGSLSL